MKKLLLILSLCMFAPALQAWSKPNPPLVQIIIVDKWYPEKPFKPKTWSDLIRWLRIWP